MARMEKYLLVGIFVSFITAAIYSPASALRWEPAGFVKGKCSALGFRKYSAQLMDIRGSWEAACASMPATINGIYFPKPGTCLNEGPLGMRGYFDVPDQTCAANWGGIKDDNCKGIDIRQYSSRLENIPSGISWNYACNNTPTNVNGVSFSRPTRCRDKGPLGMWGEFDVTDQTCRAHWGSVKKDDCKAVGVRQYSSLLENIPAGVKWEDACDRTPATVDGIHFAKPTRCVAPASRLASLGGMWGEFDVSDPSCVAKWGIIKKEGCQAAGVRLYVGLLEQVPRGLSLGHACNGTPATVAGTYFQRPTRCVQNGMLGEFDVPDPSCPGAQLNQQELTGVPQTGSPAKNSITKGRQLPAAPTAIQMKQAPSPAMKVEPKVANPQLSAPSSIDSNKTPAQPQKGQAVSKPIPGSISLFQGKVTDIKGNAITLEDTKGQGRILEVDSAAALTIGMDVSCEEDCRKQIRTAKNVVNVRRVLTESPMPAQNPVLTPEKSGKAAGVTKGGGAKIRKKSRSEISGSEEEDLEGLEVQR